MNKLSANTKNLLAKAVIIISAIATITTVIVNIEQITDTKWVKKYIFNQETTFANLQDDKLLLESLFKAQYIDSLRMGKWTPDSLNEFSRTFSETEFDEEAQKEVAFTYVDDCNISSDSSFYTKVETIIPLTPFNDKKRSLIIFGTHEIVDGHLNDSHAASVMLSLATVMQNPDDTWKLVKFSKHLLRNGSFGYMQNCKELKIGTNKYGVCFFTESVFMGEYNKHFDLIDLYDFKILLSDQLIKSYDYEGSEKEKKGKKLSPEGYLIKGKMMMHKNPQSEFYDICIKYEYDNISESKLYSREFNWAENKCFGYDYGSKKYERINSDEYFPENE